MPWITQEIRREMNRLDRLYQIQKSTGKDSHRQLFKEVKYEVACMTKTPFNILLGPHIVPNTFNIRIPTVGTLLTVNIIEFKNIRTRRNMVGHEMLHQQTIF